MRILLAEDDAVTAENIGAGLRAAGHHIRIASTGHEALTLLNAEPFDLAVLDRLMPQGDGMGVLAAIRQRDRHLPVLMLTALGAIEDRVEGLEEGADDYLVKPFALPELTARINALGRRRAVAKEEDGPEVILRWGGLTLDLLDRQVRWHEAVILVQPREFRLLEELLRAQGRIVTRTMLLESVWKLHFDPRTNIVETHLSRLRTRLAEAGCADAIVTVRGAGYRMRDGV
ncbi:response regulator [Sphingomonas sp. S17]|uniref:Response regulator transcription factor n=2 Tax=Sphingomonas paucimobilis TaxID=13689 RepID=A0A411LHQ6_SPHPI|nr:MULTISPECIES: response regulator transcription factor [Sphingomonas]EGI54858.1 response regulator [Sphingomonas sp. S17]MBQ1479399.1 response regulator transcription factor [Sphingomonas sp.]MCM3677969.1 response regulator transcription factor [Sphingomonas paucimobilis]MDG5972601.1 response regulator transcription factor [Sphingomonas paucimobilis]NNG56665.1 response regulator transcription factor [Sphingomonas paucimobilis]